MNYKKLSRVIDSMGRVKDNSDVNDLDLADINSGLTYDDLLEMLMYHDLFGELCDQQGICPPSWDDTDVDAAAQLAGSVLQGHESMSVDDALEYIAYSGGFDNFCRQGNYNSPSCLYGNDESIALEHYKDLFRQILRQHRNQFPS